MSAIATAEIAPQQTRSAQARALATHAARPAWRETLRQFGRRSARRSTLNIGLIGLGQVGQAFVRLCTDFAALLRGQGVEVRFTAALVRDVAKTRGVRPREALLTSSADEFFAQPIDLCVEVLGGVEPAATLVARCLRSGIPVVTANKSLLAARGEALAELATEHGTSLRGEASAIAGVPFLTTLRRRPFAARVRRIVGVLNGTSNFLLGELAAGASFPSALRKAQALGYAEPNPHNDLSGRDAAEKLIVILQHLGFGGLTLDHVERSGIEWLSPLDLQQAANLGGVIKPVAVAEISGGIAAGFVGPALLPRSHALARTTGVGNAVQFHSEDGEELLFGGPGAGPVVTAGTIFDDVVETAAELACGAAPFATRSVRRLDGWLTPRTGWVVRLCFAKRQVSAAAVLGALESHGVEIEHCTCAPPQPEGDVLYVRTRPASRDWIEAATTAITATLNGRVRLLRVLE